MTAFDLVFRIFLNSLPARPPSPPTSPWGAKSRRFVMADIARRSFLFGMGAALTTAALARPMALLMPTPLPFKVRRIADFTVGLDTEADRPAFFSIRIGERGIASGGIGPGGCYR